MGKAAAIAQHHQLIGLGAKFPKVLPGQLEQKMKLLEMDEKFMKRYLNEGFSGGEKKRNEILQMLMLLLKTALCM
jgi:Fe-S cluster assembly ATPase SufC